ncbi:hypothetical protein LP123_10240 [Moraxella bovis]|uniref:Lipoprotein n=1 Tax=Moraxella bovis TaxID=476 RepID=A0AAQ2QA49_MORBO|nr:hypothetical protein [Moraxella bovis]AWY20830.1 hypothetical protein DQF64_10260 [Moraxella bovis]OOR91288.1 hypothetical protein B0182_03530 [Moraxella bovis]UYZ76493.1 hypothetical protein LP093_04060 [Moraxella bovis]UYZ77555.1 hypothetical protein LP115_09750 [Moraxella bovis]UYZ81945.1 hypothetical protein LP113_04260 [Moraxella bovis]
MNKLIAILLCLPVVACATPNAPQEPTQHQKFYHSIENKMPILLNQIGFNVAYLKNVMIQELDGQDYPKIDVTEKQYAICMQNAIDNKFYGKPLSQAIAHYLSQADEQTIAYDKKILDSEILLKVNELYKDIFKLYASDERADAKMVSYKSIKNQEQALIGDGIVFSHEYTQNFIKFFDSEFTQSMAEQIDKCLEYQYERLGMMHSNP